MEHSRSQSNRELFICSACCWRTLIRNTENTKEPLFLPHQLFLKFSLSDLSCFCLPAKRKKNLWYDCDWGQECFQFAQLTIMAFSHKRSILRLRLSLTHSPFGLPISLSRPTAFCSSHLWAITAVISSIKHVRTTASSTICSPSQWDKELCAARSCVFAISCSIRTALRRKYWLHCLILYSVFFYILRLPLYEYQLDHKETTTNHFFFFLFLSFPRC